MKKLCFLVFLVIGFASESTFASGFTKTFACDTCGFAEARQIAQENHIQPQCATQGLVNGGIGLGQTNFICPSTSTTLIVANPLNRATFKFRVSTQQQYEWAPAYDIIVTEVDTAPIEAESLEVFFRIADDFRQAMEQVSNVPFTSHSVPSKIGNMSGQSKLGEFMSASSDPECSAHASKILSRSEAFRNAVQDKFTEKITQEMGMTQTWSDFTGRAPKKGSLSLGSGGVGIAVEFGKMEQKYYVTRKWANGDKLVFEVKMYGVSITMERNWRYQLVPKDRSLNLDFKLIPGASRIDGMSITGIVKPNTDLTDVAISVCLSKTLSELLSDSVVVVGGAQGGIDFKDFFGSDATGGGSLIPPAGIWIDLAGCRIVEATGNICRTGTDDCIEVKAEYLECD